MSELGLWILAAVVAGVVVGAAVMAAGGYRRDVRHTPLPVLAPPPPERDLARGVETAKIADGALESRRFDGLLEERAISPEMIRANAINLPGDWIVHHGVADGLTQMVWPSSASLKTTWTGTAPRA